MGRLQGAGEGRRAEEAAKIAVHKTGKIYMTLSLASHPSTPLGYNYQHATREKIKKSKKNHPVSRGNNSGDDGGEDLSVPRFAKESL